MAAASSLLCRPAAGQISCAFSVPGLQSALRLRPAFTDALNNMATAYLQKGLVLQVRRGGAFCYGLTAGVWSKTPLWNLLGMHESRAMHPSYFPAILPANPLAPTPPVISLQPITCLLTLHQAMEAYNAALAIVPALSDVRTNLGDLWRAQVRLLGFWEAERGWAILSMQRGTQWLQFAAVQLACTYVVTCICCLCALMNAAIPLV